MAQYQNILFILSIFRVITLGGVWAERPIGDTLSQKYSGLSTPRQLLMLPLFYVFEILCLSKSRWAMSKMSINSTVIKITLVMIIDFASTIILFVILYSSVLAFTTFSPMPNSSSNLLSFVPELYLDYVRLFISEIWLEIKYWLSPFIVLYSEESASYFQDVFEFPEIKDCFLQPSAFPFSLLLASALFTTIWTSIVASSLFAVRTVCRLSRRWRSIVIFCCRRPHVVWNVAIMPCFLVWLIGLIGLSIKLLS